ncbi:ATP-binding protein [Actinocorallia populi]|uniref:ATP-binding protein n=1 Tax=Actinocorallia populi TaxID=2079200 RepID=UPI000D090781|nr:ATP-binding protein [Actinocorallia populi]
MTTAITQTGTPTMAALLTAAAGTGVASWRLPADLDAPRVARTLAARTVANLDALLVEDVRVVASELATNAVRYSRGKPILAVEVTSTEVVVTVADQGNETGRAPRINPGKRDEGGRGLGICARLGELRITGAPSTGWQIAVHFPLTSKEAGR